MWANSAGTKFIEGYQTDKTSDHACCVSGQLRVLSDHGCSPAVRLPVHTRSWYLEPQPLVSWNMARNKLGACILPNAHVSNSCSQLCASNPIQLPSNLWIFGFPRDQIPPPTSHVFLGMNMVARLYSQWSQGHFSPLCESTIQSSTQVVSQLDFIR